MSKSPPLSTRGPVAIDYGRFSKSEQEIGDSKRRQKGLSDAWSERTGIPIDRRLSDDGVSGRNVQRREDADRYALAQFLELVNAGTIRPGDYLLLENLDRLSREQEVHSAHLLLSILAAGIRIVQLAPVELEIAPGADIFTIFRAIMELSRGHGESERKHQVITASYANNRAAAGQGEEVYQGQLPSWVRRTGEGKGARHRQIEPIPDRVDVIRRIFRLAAEGNGYTEIVRILNTEGVPAFGEREARVDPETGEQAKSRNGRLRWRKTGERIGTGRWTRSYIVTILRGTSAMGKLPTKTGELVPIPAAVTEDEWLAAQAGRAERNKHRGRSRSANGVNLFAGLLRYEHTEETLYSVVRLGRGKKWRVIVNASGKECETELVSFPEDAFEGAILRCLKEINSGEVTQHTSPNPGDVVAGRLEGVRHQLAELKAELAGCIRPPKGMVQVMTALEDEEAKLDAECRAAAHAASHPVSEAWEGAQSLIDLAKDPEHRLRLRTFLRRIVDEIRVVIVPRGWDRAAAVQMRFKESTERRNFLIAFRKDVMPNGIRASRRRRERGEDLCAVRSILDRPGLDLCNPEHVQALKKELERLDLQTV